MVKFSDCCSKTRPDGDLGSSLKEDEPQDLGVTGLPSVDMSVIYGSTMWAARNTIQMRLKVKTYVGDGLE